MIVKWVDFMKKICSNCNEELSLGKFYKRKDSIDGYHRQCKKCIIEKTKRNKRNNLKKRKEYDHEYYLKNKDKIRERFQRAKKILNERLLKTIGLNYNDLHYRMRNIIKKSKYCRICNEEKKLELSNLDHNYSLDISDWTWLCKSCHTFYDINRRKILETEGV